MRRRLVIEAHHQSAPNPSIAEALLSPAATPLNLGQRETKVRVPADYLGRLTHDFRRVGQHDG
jgi:hypothetical protein